MHKLGLKMLTPLVVLASWAATAASGQESVSVAVVGKLQTGVMAIGGETTGATISASGITWELERPKDTPAETWDALSGKLVKVTGTLRKQRGVERKERWIVAVQDLQSAELPFQIILGKPEDKVELSLSENTLYCDVRTAIGSATIERKKDRWPDKIVLRLHLSGLESLSVDTGKFQASWSVSSTGEPTTSMALNQGDQEAVLTTDSPYFTNVKLIGKKPIIPLHDGHFEVTLPAKLLEENPKQLSLRWIDFYRR